MNFSPHNPENNVFIKEIHTQVRWHLYIGIITLTLYRQTLLWPINKSIKHGCNKPRHGDACMRQWTVSSLLEVVAWRLFSTKPLSKSVFTYWLTHIIMIRYNIVITSRDRGCHAVCDSCCRHSCCRHHGTCWPLGSHSNRNCDVRRHVWWRCICCVAYHRWSKDRTNTCTYSIMNTNRSYPHIIFILNKSACK